MEYSEKHAGEWRFMFSLSGVDYSDLDDSQNCSIICYAKEIKEGHIRMVLSSQVTMKRYEFYIALFALISSLFISATSLYNQYKTSEKVGVLSVAIKDTNDIRKALHKPLEGLWSITLKYSLFKNKPGNWISEGSSILKWNPSTHTYFILVGSSLREFNGKNQDIITWWMEGSLRADINGEPDIPFSFRVEYKGITGITPDLSEPGQRYANLKDIKITKRDDQNNPVSLEGKFDDGETTATMYMERLDI